MCAIDSQLISQTKLSCVAYRVVLKLAMQVKVALLNLVDQCCLLKHMASFHISLQALDQPIDLLHKTKVNMLDN